MEAIFLACGAGGPQLKRNPLGCGMGTFYYYVFLIWPILGAAFVALVWQPYRARRWTLLVLLWLLFSVSHGYLGFRIFCSMPLTCDAGEVSSYLPSLWPQYAGPAAIAYAATVLFVAFSQHGTVARLTPRTLLLGALVMAGALHLANGLVGLVWKAAA